MHSFFLPLITFWWTQRGQDRRRGIINCRRKREEIFLMDLVLYSAHIKAKLLTIFPRNEAAFEQSACPQKSELPGAGTWYSLAVNIQWNLMFQVTRIHTSLNLWLAKIHYFGFPFCSYNLMKKSLLLLRFEALWLLHIKFLFKRKNTVLIIRHSVTHLSCCFFCFCPLTGKFLMLMSLLLPHLSSYSQKGSVEV